MRAAVYHPGDDQLVLEHVPRPVPGRDQVLLKVAAAGVCHSDTILLNDILDDTRTYVFGHENVGWAVELGENVKNIARGKLYAVHDFLAHGGHPLPGATPFLDSVGLGENGGFAEYLVVDAANLVVVPEGLAPEVAALATDSLLTAYNAVHNVAQLRGPESARNKRVLVYGVGGLGHQAVQLLKHYGATVFAVDIKPAARALALRLGAERAFHPGELQDVFAKLPPGDPGRFAVDVVVDFVGEAQSFQLSMEALKGAGFGLDNPSGTYVMVGVSGETLSFDQAFLITFRTQILTSLYGTKSDLKACLQLLSEGAIVPAVSVEPLENVNKVLDELRAHRVTGRKVLIPSLGSQ